MQALSQEFIDSCRTEDGYILRGEGMTRIEVFVDAAFAFAVTMLVIAGGQIPNTVPELFAASKQIPAFILSIAQLVLIWRTHSLWSKRFGLEDTGTVFISVCLLIVVLVYIYPIKMLFSGFFYWVSDGYFPADFDLNSVQELRDLFVYFAIGFAAISGIFIAMYLHALRLKEALRLTASEIHLTQTKLYQQMAIILIAVLALITPMLVVDRFVPHSGFVYILVAVVLPIIKKIRKQKL